MQLGSKREQNESTETVAFLTYCCVHDFVYAGSWGDPLTGI
jgi:hypothetical protein